MAFIQFMRRGTMLDDAPWTWGQAGGWYRDMPQFFADTANATSGSSDPLHYNVFNDLDTSPVNYNVGVPVDPTEYQNGYIGQTIGIY